MSYACSIWHGNCYFSLMLCSNFIFILLCYIDIKYFHWLMMWHFLLSLVEHFYYFRFSVQSFSIFVLIIHKFISFMLSSPLWIFLSSLCYFSSFCHITKQYCVAICNISFFYITLSVPFLYLHHVVVVVVYIYCVFVVIILLFLFAMFFITSKVEHLLCTETWLCCICLHWNPR